MSNNFRSISASMSLGESIGTCLKKYAVFEGVSFTGECKKVDRKEKKF